jgi:phosphate:Na+ symporter
VIGIATTMLFQSSVATITLAMAACATGWVPFVMAAALVIGDNVGTTLIPLIAARKTNVQARRAAFAHLFFNLVGLVWALALIYPMSHWISGIVGGRATGLAFGVALCHTCFNLVTALLTIGFLSYFCVMLCKFFPVHNDDDEEFHLSFIEGGVQSAAELSVDQARKETVQFGLRCQRMLDLTDQFVHMPKTDANYNHLFSRIEKYEKITDRLELEIDRYLNNLDKSQLSPRALARVRSIFQMADELESLADACYKVARSVVRRHEVNVEFIDMQQQNINQMLALTHQSMDLMMQLLQKNDLTAADMNRAYNQEDQVNGLRNQLRDQNIGNVQSGSYTYQSGVLYMEIVSGCEKICDYIINVVEALATQNDIPARDGE